MSSFFLNPITWWTGLALVSAPIIIHLINRMRFRRVKWAAMEFLLKAQKRMRRKMIIEQLILLFLRCLLVFLLALLFGRFLGLDPLAGKETRPTVHMIILDDTPSMADTGRGEGGPTTDAFTEAKKQITDRILPAAMEATTEQKVRILRLSDQADLLNPDPAQDQGPKKIETKLIEEARGALAQVSKPSTIRTSLIVALQKAMDSLDKAGGQTETAKVVHVVTDLRAIDWELEGESLAQLIRQMSDGGVKVHFIDVGTPARPVDRSKPLAFSDNVGIVELKPRARVVAVREPVDFEVRVRNFGGTHLKDVQVYFFLNGQGNIVQTLQFPDLPAGQERTLLTQVTFKQVATKEDPYARFNVVTAVLANTGADALAADNVRHAVVDVREKLVVLGIEDVDAQKRRAPPPGKQPSNLTDSHFLRKAFEDAFGQVYGKVDWVSAKPEALDRHDLRQYSSVFLVNVPQLTQSQADNLDRYIRGGGGVGVFLGPDVVPENYNTQLYRGGAGFFPIPLPPKPVDEMTAEQQKKYEGELIQRILVRDSAAKSHPALAGVYTNELGIPIKNTDLNFHFSLPNFKQYWRISRLGEWRKDTSLQELYCLANTNRSADYEDRIAKLRDAITSKYDEPKFEKYRDVVNKTLEDIRKGAADNIALPLLARKLDGLLADQVTDGSPEEALLREFWGQPEMADARTLALALRDDTKFGDPLYFAKRVGNGRITVMTTSIEQPWNDWPTAGVDGWIPVMREMQKYLAGGGAEENRTVGTSLGLAFESGRYKPTVKATFLTTDTGKNDRGQAAMIRTALPDQPLVTQDKEERLNFTDKNPGIYMFELLRQKRDGDPPNTPAETKEYVASVLNIDAAHEGALSRATGNDLADQAKGAEIHSFDDSAWLETLKQKRTDLSSGRWIYLVILLVLILEQAMAVRLSHHSRPDDLEAFAPSAAAAFAHGTPPPVSAAAEPEVATAGT